ncbi:MAG: hypothetical protein H7Z21_03440 [Hymenobacter sp.]|nr:hypothetical protein [Hymenobacter sp.]
MALLKSGGNSFQLDFSFSKQPPTMKKVLFLALAAASFSFTSCDSKKEDAQETGAENVEAAGEMKADAMEEQADAVRDSADATSDKMEDAADAADAPATTAPATTPAQ